MSSYPLEQHKLAANTIRGLTMDAVQKSGNGHPGMPMGMADVAVVLWSRYLKHNPQKPHWPDRDRFVLSAGHGSMLLYSLLHLSGYALPLDEIKNLRQWGSKTPGHPEYEHTVGVETTTGPLGQGITNAIGLALGERWLATHYNQPDYPVVDHHTYVIASDGDLMEGVAHEASSLAGHLGLSKLIVLYDQNNITIDGSTDLAFTEDVLARYEAYNWHVQQVDGHDPEAIAKAIEAAQAETERPSLIACQTKIGFGSPNKEGTSKSHGSALGEEEIRLTKENLGWPQEPLFYVPEGVYEFMGASGIAGAQKQASWQAMMAQYGEAHPDLNTAFDQALAGELPEGWNENLPDFEVGKAIATRASSGQVLNAIAPHVPYLLGGSGDLTGSNKTKLTGESSLTREDFSGRYVHYGVREHGMAGMMNGLALHGGIRPYGGTFLVFSDYLRPSLRLSALMGLPVIYVFTHDSIGLGEDGPTHQPIEHLMSLRAIPNLMVIRPGDAGETAVAWQTALENKSGPTALILSRQGVPTLDRTQYASEAEARQGGYIISDAENPQAILIATGTELPIAISAQQLLTEKGVASRVVSMPSWELFAAQSDDYQEQVLPSTISVRVSIEAGTTLGWDRYIGKGGKAIGVDHFGASAPYQTLYEKFGLTAEAATQVVLELL